MKSVSVITTLYNYEKYVKECIESFINQDFKDSEMIIVNDCSTDNSDSVVRKFSSDRIKYISLDINKGYSHAKNVAIKNSCGKYLVHLDADDIFTNNGISLRYNKIEENYDFVHGLAFELKDGKTIKTDRWKKWYELKDTNLAYKSVHAQGIIYKRDIHKEIGLFDENMRCKADREFTARVFNNGYKIGFVQKEVSIYRKHEQMMSRSKEKVKNNEKLEADALKLIEKRKNKDFSGLEML